MRSIFFSSCLIPRQSYAGYPSAVRLQENGYHREQFVSTFTDTVIEYTKGTVKY